MEQKQLDELEDSFFGEEFIEDLEDIPPASKNQDVKIEPREDSAELRLRKSAKKVHAPTIKKSVFKKSEKSSPMKQDKDEMKEDMDMPSVAEKETVAVNVKP